MYLDGKHGGEKEMRVRGWGIEGIHYGVPLPGCLSGSPCVSCKWSN